MKIYRIIDYSLAGSLTVINYFIDLDNFGIEIKLEGNYSEPMNKKVFKPEKLSDKKVTILKRYIDSSRYEEFKTRLSDFWNKERTLDKELSNIKSDPILEENIEYYGKRIIRSFFQD